MKDNSVFWFCAGAIKLHTPLLMPRNKKLYEHNEASYFMDHSGMLVMLPYDLRVSSIISAGKASKGLEDAVVEFGLGLHFFRLLSCSPEFCTPPLDSWSPDHILKKQRLFVLTQVKIIFLFKTCSKDGQINITWLCRVFQALYYTWESIGVTTQYNSPLVAELSQTNCFVSTIFMYSVFQIPFARFVARNNITNLKR